MDTFSLIYSQSSTAFKRVMVVIKLLVVCSGAWAQVVHVDQNATGTGDGASWVNAFTNLQSAIDAAATVASSSNPIQVWVKADTYKPTTSTDRTIRFKIKNYVEMYGGFDGTETSLSQRDINKNPTVISGDIGVVTDRTDNSQGLFLIDANVNGPVVIDGFEIEDSYDPSNVNTIGIISSESGASATELKFSNCTFLNNEAGFGSVLGYGSPSTRFYTCKFLDNFGTVIWSTNAVEVYNSIFTGNVQTIYIQLGSVTVSNSTFANNSGNALFLQNQATPLVSSIYNNIFWGNTGTDIVVQGNASENLSAANNLVQDAFTFGTNTITDDPQFTDGANGDFSITHCSPAVDQGDNSLLPGTLTTDINGDNRIFNTTIDLGAYENQIAPLFFSAVEIGDAFCNGEATGQISVNAGGGAGPLPTYSLDGVNFSSNAIFSNLAAGTHTVYITDGVCVYSEDFTVNEPDLISIEVTVVEGAANDELIVSGTGGAGLFQYSLDGINYQSSGTFAFVSGGSRTVYAKDANNCLKSETFYFSDEGRQVLFVDKVATGGNGDGKSWANAVTSLQAAINMATTIGTVDRPAELWVKADTYYPTLGTDRTAKIELKDKVMLFGGFAGTETARTQRDFKVNKTVLSGDIGVQADSTDNSYGIVLVDDDVANGVTLDGFELKGAFSLADAGGGILVTGQVGELTILNCTFQYNLANNGACVNSESAATTTEINISESVFLNNGFYSGTAYIGSAIKTKCVTSIYNSIFVDNKSGNGGVLYALAGSDVDILNSTFHDNSAGTASCIIAQSGSLMAIRNSIFWGNSSVNQVPFSGIGSSSSVSNNIIENMNLTNNLNVDPLFVDEANLDLRVKHCSPAVDAGENSFLQPTQTTDYIGDPRIFNTTVDMGALENQIIPLSITVSAADDLSCNGSDDGAILVTGAGGSSLLEYSIDGGAFSTNTSFEDMEGGTHTVTVRDASGCEVSITEILAEPAPIVVSVSGFNNITCNGEDDGTISGSVTGGTGTYLLSLDGTNFDTTPITDAFSFDGLAPGTYTITARDINNCTGTSSSVTITHPPVLTISLSSANLTCFNDASGTITITATGGTGALEYSLDGSAFQSSSEFGGLAAGGYTAYVRDVNGCTLTDNVTLTQPLEVTASAVPATASCQGSLDGSITISTTNGIAPFSYSLDGGTPQASNVFDQLNPGTYSVKVTDANGCGSSVADIVVGANVVITPDITTTHVVCAGDASGLVGIAATGGLEPYQFSLNGGDFQTSSEFSGLVAGTYDVTVKDANGCTATGTATISEPGAIATGSLAVTNLSCAGDGSGALVVEASGGTGALTFSIDGTNFQSGNTFSGLSAGIYTLTITDEASCSKSEQVVITEPGSFTADAQVANVSCFGAGDGSLTLSVTGSEADTYTYSVDGETFQESTTFAGLSAGEYTVIVKNQSGCTQAVSGTVAQPAQLVPEVEVVHTTCGQANGSVKVSASGGTGSYLFSLNGEDFISEPTFVSLPAGEHVVTVRDESGCLADVAVTINAGSSITATTSDNDGQITVTVEGGTAPYQYSAGGDFQDSNEFNLEPGEYTITIKDAVGCEATVDLTIELETGISRQLLSTTFLAYPNPASTQLWFVSDDIKTVHLFDLSGNEVLTVNNYRTRESIDLSTLVPGVVIVELELSTGERIKQRLIIEK